MERISPTLLSWASVLEPETRAQAERTASLPFIHPHVALMPDAHVGKGATVGSVIPTLGAIIPAAVGVDIGCGMIAVRTQVQREELTRRGPLSELRRAVEAAVPLSAGQANRSLTASAVPRVERLEREAEAAGFDPGRYARGWALQLGSLGSGNHFIEVSADETGRVWLFLHSGSRGVGNRLAQRHIAVAREDCRRRGTVPPEPDLSHLREGTEEFDAYLRELGWAQSFALLNREEMVDRLAAAVSEHLRRDVVEEERINAHHNYTVREEHFGERVWVSRKGAIDAAAGVPGLVPGSMGTASYVVTGRGEPMSLRSSPHGAGRALSRTAARKRFTRADLRRSMRGIEHRDTDAFLDEVPGAYKDIHQVMADAADLVEVRHELHQLVNVKGD